MSKSEEAFNIYIKYGGKISNKDIADKVNCTPSSVAVWKSKYKWKDKIGKAGAPQGNKRAIGNKGGGAPPGNLNNLKHGMYCEERFNELGFLEKYIPAVTKNIIKDIAKNGISELDMLWHGIVLLYSNLLRAQKIMHVKSHNDITKEIKKKSKKEIEYEIQFAWDKEERFIKSQADALFKLNKMIADYENLLNKNYAEASEEQKLRVQKLKVEIEKLTADEEDKNIKIEFVKASEKDENS